MKILHVCESIIGGTGSYLAEIIPHQVREYGAENVGLLIPKNQLDYLERPLLDAAPQIVTFSRPTRSIGSVFLLGRYLRTVSSFRPDLVHAHSSIAGVVVRTARLNGGADIVFCPHGWSVDMTGAKHVRKIAEWVERGLAHFPDKVVVISGHEYKRGIELGISPENLKLIPNGISMQIPQIAPAPWDDDRIKVLYAGRFDYQKGVDILLKAVADLGNQVTVRLVGDFAVSDVAWDTPLPESVIQLGWLDRDGVAAQMMSCDILVVPSRWEGFGLVAVEAMRLSIPVLASAVGGLKEILGDGQYGYLVPPEDPVALGNQLLRLTKQTLTEVGAVGHKRFLAAYTSDRMVRQLHDLYAEMASDRPRPSTSNNSTAP